MKSKITRQSVVEETVRVFSDWSREELNENVRIEVEKMRLQPFLHWKNWTKSRKFEFLLQVGVIDFECGDIDFHDL